MENIESAVKEGEKDFKPLNQGMKSQQDQKNLKEAQNDPKRQTQNEQKTTKSKKPQFKFTVQTVEIIFFKKLDKNFLKDLSTYTSNIRNRKYAVQLVKKFFALKQNLQDSARLSHQILEDLTIKCPEPKVPRVIVTNFIQILIKNKNQIKHLLNQKKGDKLLDVVPLEYLIDIIEIYDIKLQKKDADIFFKEIQNSKYFIEIPRFIAANSHHDFQKQLTPIIQRLITQKEYKKLRIIPDLKKLFNENPVLVKEKSKMLRNTAMYHFRSEGWESIEEIFEFRPEIIAAIINGNFGSKPSQFQKKQNYMQGVVAICERNPNVLGKLRPDTRKVIAQKKAEMQKNGINIPENPLRVHAFQPSKKDHFSFEQFSISRNQIVWVDDKLSDQKLKEIKEELLMAERIAIDTESTLVRTPIDHDLDVLSLIQVSTETKIYLIDPYNSQHPEIKSIFQKLFGNKQKTVIGHTIEGDIEGIAHFFGLENPLCKVIDIKIKYEQFQDSNKQVSLKAISKNILGKQICKKYTCTNWDRRPLNMCQIHYAAMDAYIILKIWDQLSKLIEQKKKNPQQFKKLQKDTKQTEAQKEEEQSETKQGVAEQLLENFEDKQQ